MRLFCSPTKAHLLRLAISTIIPYIIYYYCLELPGSKLHVQSADVGSGKVTADEIGLESDLLKTLQKESWSKDSPKGKENHNDAEWCLAIAAKQKKNQSMGEDMNSKLLKLAERTTQRPS